MQKERLAIYVALLILINITIWWVLLNDQKKDRDQELINYTSQESALARETSHAISRWAAQQSSTPSALDQEILQRFITPLELTLPGEIWVFKNSSLLYVRGKSFENHSIGSPLKQVFNPLLHKSLYNSISEGGSGHGVYTLKHRTGPEYAAWHTVTANGDQWTIGIATPASTILSNTINHNDLLLEFSAGVVLSLLSLFFLVIIFRHYRSELSEMQQLQSEIIDHQQLTSTLREDNDKYRSLFTHSRAIQLISDPATGALIDANQRACDYYGYLPGLLKSITISDLNILSERELNQELENAKAESRDFINARHKLKNGEVRDVEVYNSPFTLAGRNLICSIIHDVTDRKNMEKEIQHIGHHDVLTNIPNRALLDDRLTMAIEQAKRHSHYIAVLFLDLDNFKPVNDTFGHHAGDLLLIQVAERLQYCIRKSDTVARFGGDEFIVMLPETSNIGTATHIADKIIDNLGLSFLIEAQQIKIGCSIGIALFPQNGDSPEELIRQADKAMYQAKQSGKHCYHIAPREKQTDLFDY
ncbi:MAG: diguanylate cyclase [Gammaproteobacteria bacterium]|nr:diguanylate cyclase [Gammaproteobacteria bacterium]